MSQPNILMDKFKVNSILLEDEEINFLSFLNTLLMVTFFFVPSPFHYIQDTPFPGLIICKLHFFELLYRLKPDQIWQVTQAGAGNRNGFT